MARSKTASFWVSQTITLPAATAAGDRIQGTIDLSAYINVPTGQCVAIEEVDYIHQADTDFGGAVRNMLSANGSLSAQLTDLNQGAAFVRADNLSLVSSSALNIDQTNCIATEAADFYPDNFGKLEESRYVVNDTLYLVAGPDNANLAATIPVYVTCRIKMRVIKLEKQDWMAIAIQSTAADN